MSFHREDLPQQIKSHGGVWYVLAAAVLWGTTGTSQGLAAGEKLLLNR
jgi:hypothetical protein